jgi:hypothetical protein
MAKIPRNLTSRKCRQPADFLFIDNRDCTLQGSLPHDPAMCQQLEVIVCIKIILLFFYCMEGLYIHVQESYLRMEN